MASKPSSKDELEVKLARRILAAEGTMFLKADMAASDFIGISTQEAYKKLLSDESSFFQAHKESIDVAGRKVTEVVMEAWKEVDAGSGMMRTLMYRYPLDVVGCPPSTAIREVQRCRYDPESKELLLDTSCQSLEVPYGTYFTIENRLKFTPGGTMGCRLDITMQTFFSRSTMLEWKINSNAISSTKESWEGWVAFAKIFIDPPKQQKATAAQGAAQVGVTAAAGTKGKSSRKGSKKNRDAEAAAAAATVEAKRVAKMREEKAAKLGLDVVTLAAGLAAFFIFLVLWAELRLWSAEAAAPP